METLNTNAVVEKIEELLKQERELNTSVERIIIRNLANVSNGKVVTADKEFVNYIIKRFKRNELMGYDKGDIVYELPFLLKLDSQCLSLIYMEISEANIFNDVYPLNKRGTDYNYNKKPTRVYLKDTYKQRLSKRGYNIDPLKVLDELIG
jgi:hypothetical protein